MSSGYCGPIAKIDDVMSSRIVGSWAPSNRMFRVVRRIMRRRTYPRPSFPGVTPSPINIAAVRAWSAITLNITSDE